MPEYQPTPESIDQYYQGIIINSDTLGKQELGKENVGDLIVYHGGLLIITSITRATGQRTNVTMSKMYPTSISNNNLLPIKPGEA